MPYLKKTEVDGGIIGFWEISEKPAELGWLAEQFADDPEYLKLSSEKRRTEFLVVRALLVELTGRPLTIHYKKTGEPFLPEKNLNISISHSKNLATVILHKKRSGIDVEVFGRRVEKIADKFLSEEEISFAEQSGAPEKYMTTLWSVKEAIYKCMGNAGIEFKKQIFVHQFIISEEGQINATLISENNKQEISLNYFFLKNNAVVWCVL
jgi:4'-phosphopantetheinyl transferase